MATCRHLPTEILPRSHSLTSANKTIKSSTEQIFLPAKCFLRLGIANRYHKHCIAIGSPQRKQLKLCVTAKISKEYVIHLVCSWKEALEKGLTKWKNKTEEWCLSFLFSHSHSCPRLALSKQIQRFLTQTCHPLKGTQFSLLVVSIRWAWCQNFSDNCSVYI